MVRNQTHTTVPAFVEPTVQWGKQLLMKGFLHDTMNVNDDPADKHDEGLEGEVHAAMIEGVKKVNKLSSLKDPC